MPVLRRRFLVATPVLALAVLVAVLAVVRQAPTAAADGLPAGAVFVPVTPYRVFDSRTGTGIAGGSTARIAADTSFTVQMAGTGSGDDAIPGNAVAVMFNLTYVDATGDGYVAVWPAGAAQPNASNLNKVGPGPVPNSVTVKLGTGGAVAIYNQGSATHLFGDVAGYFVIGGGGAQGEQGPQGAQGTPGATGPQGPIGRATALPQSVATVGGAQSGAMSTLTTDRDGRPVITYSSPSHGIDIIWCDDPGCTSRATSHVDNFSTALEPAIAIADDGTFYATYYDSIPKDLKLAKCADPSCTTASITTLDSTGDVGDHSSIAIGTDGAVIVSYADKTNGDLRVLHCDTADCSATTITTVDGSDNVGQYTAIAVGADGYPVIAYRDKTNNRLKTAHCETLACDAAVTITAWDDAVGLQNQIVISAAGLPLVSTIANGARLDVLSCNTITCSTGFVNVVATGTLTANSITIGSDQLPVVSYYDAVAGVLKVAHCPTANCFGATLMTVDAAGDVGDFNSITIAADGMPVISYLDHTSFRLKVAHCGNSFCQANVRRR